MASTSQMSDATSEKQVEKQVEKSTAPTIAISAATPAAATPSATPSANASSSVSASSSNSATPVQGRSTSVGAADKSVVVLPVVPVVPVAPLVPEEEAVSYVNQDGDWKYRKINLFKVMRGFVSQLKPGQDLTKISLPAECCTPYGLLEVMGSRELAMFHLTFGMNRHPDDPLERFFAALRFFFGTVRSERFDKKPWNPVLGETHITYADVLYGEDGVGTTETAAAPATTSNGKTATSSAASAAPSSSNPAAGSATGPKSRTIFVGEQVSHHPPISAISLSNEREQVNCQANVSFTVKFGGNQVTVATAGALQLTSKKFNETYELTKCLPDMVVRNVVWGKKYIMWEGDVTMTCPQTGYTAFLKFKEKSSQNIVKGYIVIGNSDDPIIEINGVAGERIFYHHMNGQGAAEQRTLLDLTREPSARIHYLPTSKLAPLSSVGVWEKVNKAIVDDNISLADKEKKVIEQAQRDRAKARLEMKQEYQGYYFDMSPDGIWQYKNNMDLQTVLQEGAHSIDPNPESHLDASDPENSDDEFVSQEESVEPLLAASNSHDPRMSDLSGASNNDSPFSDADRSPITSGDEAEDNDIDPALASSSQQDAPQKRRRGSSTGMKPKSGSSSTLALPNLASSSSKKELRAEKKKAREEAKMVVSKMKEEKKKGTTTALLLENQAHAGWCKVRNLMKQWKDRYLVLLPGRLVIFRSPSEAAKSSASGMLLLQGCDVRPRPSKKDGSCFKIFSLNQYPIYSRQGLKGESISSAILPVGADYCILRCTDINTMNTWIDKIRQCIPDWEKSKTLIRSAGIDYFDSDSDSDSGDDSEVDPSSLDNGLLPSPSSSSLHPSSSTLSLTAAANANATVPSSSNASSGTGISNEEILNQMGQLYKITRKMSQRQRKYMDNMDDFRTRVFTEQLTDIRRCLPAPSGSSALSGAAEASSSNASGAAARKNPFDKMKAAKADKPPSLASRIQAELDAKTVLLLAIIIYLVFHVILS